MWGAIHSAEIGDGTLECRDIPHTVQMLDLFLNEDALLNDMCDCIEKNKAGRNLRRSLPCGRTCDGEEIRGA